MPNLRTKTWTTTTPAYVEDVQFWEDHLISDAVAAKAASSVQTVNSTAPDADGNVDVVALPAGGTVGQVLTKKSSTDGDADWENPASSGHTIVDEDDTDMPYRTNLQFLNADVTDDSANDATVVDCKGSKGDPGQAATITIGTTTTLPAGSSATVTNSGTSSAAVFNFGIPKGADGSGAGDMLKADYDPNSVVELAGGIPDYVASQAYTLPTAASNVLGGVKVGTNLSIDASGVLSATDTNTDTLHDLTDVDISLPSNGQALLYNSTSGKWENGDVAGSAADISYDNTSSGLTADDVQEALDEIETNVETKANSADVPLKTQISNLNLLDNPWFTVNQRGQSTYTNIHGYCVDRWALYGDNTQLSKTDNGVEIVIGSNSSDNAFAQNCDIGNELDGKRVTFSMICNNVLDYNTITIPTKPVSSGWQVTDIITAQNGVTLKLARHDNGTFQIVIRPPKDGVIYTFRAVKMEIGDISTLSLDTYPNYTTELLKCRRYFIRLAAASIGYGQCEVANTVTVLIPIPVAMRTNPVGTVSGDIKFKNTMNTNYNPLNTISVFSDQPTTVIGAHLSNSSVSIPQGTVGRVYGASGSYLDLSADL